MEQLLQSLLVALRDNPVALALLIGNVAQSGAIWALMRNLERAEIRAQTERKELIEDLRQGTVLVERLARIAETIAAPQRR